MKNILLLVLGLFTCLFYLNAQTFGSAEGTTRAVVIGISDYQDEHIPDLRYAHKDAEAFVAYLQSDKGGRLEDQYIRMLINEQAKAGDIIAQFDWLIAESKAGDKAIIYFSGHGDVERVTKFQRGYLLAYDSPPAAYMAGGTLSVQNLQDIITSLSEIGVQVIFISDACRSGKLAGSDTGGAQATTAALTKQFANEIKILSCQPNEFSLEGAQWGGGRGCFSYNLVDGLYGLADLDNDRAVSVLELERYLEDRVPRETAPQSQIPMSTGNKGEELAFVDKNWLEAFKLQKDKERPSFDQLASRNIEEALLSNADTSIREQYRLFAAALEIGNLLEPKGTSADDYFRKLIAEPKIRSVHGLLKRNFAAALQNESQEILNALMKNDAVIWSDIYAGGFSYDYIPAYLARAIEILGERHYMYKQLKAKQAYFEAKSYRTDKYPHIRADSLNRLFIAKCEEALKYDPEAAYVYYDLALSSWVTVSDYKKSYQYSQKALELSPNWVAALYMVGKLGAILATSTTEELAAKDQLKKGLTIDSTFIPFYEGLSFEYISDGENEFYKQKYLEKVLAVIQAKREQAPALYYMYAGAILMRFNRNEEAEQYLLKFVELTKQQDAGGYVYLSWLYISTKRYAEAETVLKKAVALKPLWRDPATRLAYFYLSNLNQPEKAEAVCLQVIALDSTLSWAYSILGDIYWSQNKLKEAAIAFKKVTELDPFYDDVGMIYPIEFVLATIYHQLGKEKEAQALFRSIVEHYPNPGDLNTAYMVIHAQFSLGTLEAMEQTIQNAIKSYPNDANLQYNIACIYSLTGQSAKALTTLEQSLKNGYNNYDWILKDPDFDSIRKLPEFKALMKQYFPDWVKE
ncbi:MAG: caspase family protein [Saprospiraceae bacterium]|nr:caspase family protein [Saprospiraceae bacterium]